MSNTLTIDNNSICDRCDDISDEDANKLANQLKALAHPARLQILQRLGEWNEGCCNDFCACIPLAQSTISQHLKILNNAGFIEYKPAGNCSRYSLIPNALDEVMKNLSSIRQLADKSASKN